MPKWIPVTESLPPEDLPVPLWGDRLVAGQDFPMMGTRCSCHDEWILDGFDDQAYMDDEATWTRRMLGTVTHWLDWRPGPEGA